MDKKKITIAVVAVIAVIAIAIIVSLINKDTKTVYTISFNTNGGTEVVASQEIEDGKTATKPANPTKDGYEFLGWYLNGVYFDFKTPVEENMTLEAKWKEIIVDEEPDINEEENKDDEVVEDNKEDEEETTKVTTYTVKFDSKGGSKVASKTVEKNKTVKAPTDPTRDGYIFKGWYLGSTKYDFSKKVTKNITLTAKWEEVEEEKPEVKEYTVTFKSEGGSAVKSQTVESGKTATEPTKPTRDGYNFICWTYNNEAFNFATKITKNITLVAKWQKIETTTKEYTVKFNTDGGSEVKSQTVKENETASRPGDPTREGYTFIGWYYNGATFNFSTKITSNIELVAKWEKNAVITYKVVPNPESWVGECKIYVLKDGVEIDGYVDIEFSGGTKKTNILIPKAGKEANIYEIKNITNVREK